MANIKYAAPILDGFGAGDLYIVADPTTDMGVRAAQVFGGVYLGGNLQAAHDAAVSGRMTTVLIYPGTYTLTSALALTKGDIRYKAAIVNPTNPTVIITSSLADTVQVDANNIAFEGIEFKAGDNACANLIDVSDTVATTGLSITNCVFNPNAKATVVAISASDATYAASRARITNNKFLRGFDGPAIAIGVLGLGNSDIKDNHFQITSAKNAITLADTGAATVGAGLDIADNLFVGADFTGDEVAIAISGTEDTTGLITIRRNNLAYCAVAGITQDKVNDGVVLNYNGQGEAGGTLVDPSS